MMTEAYDFIPGLRTSPECLPVVVRLDPITAGGVCSDCLQETARWQIYIDCAENSDFPSDAEGESELCEECTWAFAEYVRKKSQELPKDVLTSRISHLRDCDPINVRGTILTPMVRELCCSCEKLSHTTLWVGKCRSTTLACDSCRQQATICKLAPHYIALRYACEKHGAPKDVLLALVWTLWGATHQ